MNFSSIIKLIFIFKLKILINMKNREIRQMEFKIIFMIVKDVIGEYGFRIVKWVVSYFILKLDRFDLFIVIGSVEYI